MNKTLCFTGSRPSKLCGYTHESYVILVDYVMNLCESYIQKGYTTFITGGAQGFDQLAFWAVNKLKRKYPNIKNVVYVPYKGQERRWRKLGLFGQDEYNLMLKLADDIVYLNNELQDQSAIINALFNRNHAMVDASDLMIALYADNTWSLSDTKGGTAECMRYATKKDCPIHQITYQIQNNEIICK